MGAFVEFTASGELHKATYATAETFVLAFVLAILIGVTLGILVGGIPWLDRTLNPTLEFIRAIPSPVKVPVFVLFLGYTSGMKLVVVVISAVLPILLNTRSGMKEINPLFFDVGKTSHLSTFTTILALVVNTTVGALDDRLSRHLRR